MMQTARHTHQRHCVEPHRLVCGINIWYWHDVLIPARRLPE